MQPEPVAKAARGRKLGREPAEAVDTGGFIGKAQKAMRVDLTLDGGILLRVHAGPRAWQPAGFDPKP